MTLCSAVNCKNVGVHAFPKDIKRRKLWVKAVRKKNWQPTNHSRLCAVHFKPDDYNAKNLYTGDDNLRKVLKKTAVPSIFSYNTDPLELQRSDILQQSDLERSKKKRSVKTRGDGPISALSGIQTGNECEAQIKNEQLDGMEIATPIYWVEVPGNYQPSDSTESKTTQVNLEYIYGSIERHKDKDDVIAFYTGFQTYDKFYSVFSTLRPMAHLIKYHGSDAKNISLENQFFMTMMKLRQNKCNFELAQFFHISLMTVYKIFITWIGFMNQLWKKLNNFTEEDFFMLESCIKNGENTRVTFDGAEVPIKNSGNLASQQSQSSYSGTNTLKVVGGTPGGFLFYYSLADLGSISDLQTVKLSTQQNNILKTYEPGDNFQEEIGARRDIASNIPTFLKETGHITNLKLLKERNSNRRAQMKRLIGLLKTYKIVKEELHQSFLPLAQDIFFVCFMCCNFRDCAMK